MARTHRKWWTTGLFAFVATSFIMLGILLFWEPQKRPVRTVSPKIESTLARMLQVKMAEGPRAARELVLVEIEVRRSLSHDDESALDRAGAKVRVAAPWGVEALVPYGKLQDVADLEFVDSIRVPLKPIKRS